MRSGGLEMRDSKGGRGMEEASRRPIDPTLINGSREFDDMGPKDFVLLCLPVGDPECEFVSGVAIVSGFCERGEETKFVVGAKEGEDDVVRLLDPKDGAAR